MLKDLIPNIQVSWVKTVSYTHLDVYKRKVKDSLNVEVVEQFVNLCSLNGRKIIRDAIFDHHLDLSLIHI